MTVMRTLIVLILAGCWGLLSAAETPTLSSVQKVYLLPMTGGLDQYLAERLTAEGVFKVVVDPKQADAIWSERVDPAFATVLGGMYPAPRPAEKEKEEKAEQKDQQQPRRSYGRARGTLFLVGISLRQVIWSTYRKLDDTSSEGLHRAARDIVKQLKKDLSGKE